MAAAVAIFLLLAGRISLPLINPDEFTYGHLARSIADGDGLSWRGAHEPLRAALYVFAIAPAWLGASTTDAYALAKAEGVLLIAQSAWTITAFGPWHVQRYVLYVVPVLFLTAALASTGLL